MLSPTQTSNAEPRPPVRIPCPICDSRKYVEIKTFPDGVTVGKCQNCGLLYTPHRHSRPHSLYDEKDLATLRYLFSPIIEKKKRHFRERNFQEYLEIISRHTVGKKLLDVGCAHGFFLHLARIAGFTVAGIEPSPGMAEFARTVLNLEIVAQKLEEVELPPRTYDAISCTDSFEYVPRPREALQKMVSGLKEDGIIFIKVPNGLYFSLRHQWEKRFLKKWFAGEAFAPSLRVVHYTAERLACLCREAHLEIVERGYCLPIDSPAWLPWTGLWLEFEAPWFMGFWKKGARRIMHSLGLLQESFFKANYLSQGLYVVAKKRENV